MRWRGLLEVAATQTGRLFNASRLAAPFQLSLPTIRDYLVLLERLFLLERLAPWHSNRLKRLVKDAQAAHRRRGTGLRAARRRRRDTARRPGAARATDRDVSSTRELRRQAGGHRGSLRFFHFRDKDGTEVDLVIEGRGGPCRGRGGQGRINGHRRGLPGPAQARRGDRRALRRPASSSTTARYSAGFGHRLGAVPIRRLWGNPRSMRRRRPDAAAWRSRARGDGASPGSVRTAGGLANSPRFVRTPPPGRTIWARRSPPRLAMASVDELWSVDFGGRPGTPGLGCLDAPDLAALGVCWPLSVGGGTVGCRRGEAHGEVPGRSGRVGSWGATLIILANGKTNEVAQRTDDTGALWVRLGELPGATGWQMKPDGARAWASCACRCRGDRRDEWIADADGWVWFCYSEFADNDRPEVRARRRRVEPRLGARGPPRRAGIR